MSARFKTVTRTTPQSTHSIGMFRRTRPRSRSSATCAAGPSHSNSTLKTICTRIPARDLTSAIILAAIKLTTKLVSCRNIKKSTLRRHLSKQRNSLTAVKALCLNILKASQGPDPARLNLLSANLKLRKVVSELAQRWKIRRRPIPRPQQLLMKTMTSKI